MTAKIMMGAVFLFVLIGAVGESLGMTGFPKVEIPDINTFGFLDFLAPVQWAVNGLFVFIGMVTWSHESVPPVVFSLVFVPLILGLVWCIVSMVRGTSA